MLTAFANMFAKKLFARVRLGVTLLKWQGIRKPPSSICWLEFYFLANLLPQWTHSVLPLSPGVPSCFFSRVWLLFCARFPGNNSRFMKIVFPLMFAMFSTFLCCCSKMKFTRMHRHTYSA